MEKRKPDFKCGNWVSVLTSETLLGTAKRRTMISTIFVLKKNCNFERLLKLEIYANNTDKNK